KYAPKGCKLYINDYNEYIPAKTNDIYNIAMKLKELGVIDGIGMQSHLATNYPSASVYKTGLEKFLSTGLDVQITELDIETKGNDSARAQLFQDVFQMAVDHADQISSFTVWGTHDDISWRRSETPLLFGSKYSPKPDYEKVMSIKVNASVVTTTATTTVAPVITTTTVAGPAVTKYGDANCDGEVNMADAVLIMQYLANPNKYGLNGSGTSHMTAQGLANADVYDSGDGVSSADALSIQKYLLQLVKTLPESVSAQKKTDAVNTTAPTTTKAPTATTVAAGKTLLSNSFENGAGSFEGRGDAAVALDKSSYYTGSQSLFVSGRTDNWNGAAIPLSTSEYVPGTAYSFSAAVMQATGSATDVQMTLQYTLNGEDNYDQIATATAKDKTWTDLSNTSFKIPAGATNLILYVELPDSLGDYYLDDVTIASDGTASKIQTGGGVANPVVTTTSTPSTSGGKVDPSKPMMAISFDDGTSQYGTRIVDALAKEGFRATFFYVGDWIKDTNEIKHAYECGMEIANHTTSHPHLPQLGSSQIRSEFDQTYSKLKSIIGAEPSKLMRLPYLESNTTVQQALYDVPLISCSIDTQDWNGASKDQIVNTIKSAMNNGSANGAIILCHETYATTAAAMEEIAPYAKAQGWQIVTISEMFAAKGKQLNGGQVYTKVG
ncbi:MAG: endo-1,4-beta-xylanase, partial [Ruminococcus sp.]|nr:endo-1,4-beta-xylanase [Ruminococcus sp.]